jgi:cell fate regulator YaaT (PSP1 superfamily)
MAKILGSVNYTEDLEEDQIRRIERIATEEDIAKRAKFEEQEKDAYRICREKINKLSLAMKLVSAHYILDDPKVMFFFTAENRIDFRELVKELVAHFKMRIELRQIGVRDEARVIGGVAVCGRQLCCHSLTDNLSPVSIKMAKEQNLSLNSLKISGPCGRLLCCLAYEQEHYSEERKLLPHEGSRISVEGVGYKVTEINIFSGKVFLSGPEGKRLELPSSSFKRSESGAWLVELPKEDDKNRKPEYV